MKAIANPIHQRFHSIKWNAFLKKMVIVLFFLTMTRLAMIGDQTLVIKLGWVVLVLVIICSCEDIVALWCFISLFVIFPSSIWYVDGDFGFLYREFILLENEIYNFKPNEIFLILFCFKIFFKGITVSSIIKWPKTNINKSAFSFLVAILVGLIIGTQNGYSTRSIFLASEFRILIEGFIFFYLTYSCINSYEELLNTLQVFIYLALIKGVFAVLEASGSIPKLFYTSGYSISIFTSIVSGVHDLNLFIFAILILSSFLWLYRGEKLYYLLSHKFIVFYIFFFALIVVLSFRRTNYVMLIVGLSILLAKSNLNRFLRLSIVLSFFGVFFLLILNITGLNEYPLLKFIQLRLSFFNAPSQYDQVIVSNNAHIRDFLLGLEFVKENTLWGLGVGSRFFADRSMVYETSFIHNGILHSWVKFGLLGAISYVLFYFFSIRACFLNAKNLIVRHWVPLAVFAFIISNLISELFMPPFYQNFQKTSLIFLSLSLVIKFNDLLKINEL